MGKQSPGFGVGKGPYRASCVISRYVVIQTWKELGLLHPWRFSFRSFAVPKYVSSLNAGAHFLNSTGPTKKKVSVGRTMRIPGLVYPGLVYLGLGRVSPVLHGISKTVVVTVLRECALRRRNAPGRGTSISRCMDNSHQLR